MFIGLVLRVFIQAMDLVVLAYMLLYFAMNLGFVALSQVRIRRELGMEQVRPAAGAVRDNFLPTITLLVPAYNEEVTIIESLRSLLRLQYPSFEIVICNDGSKDRTMEVLRREFQFVRTELEYDPHLRTQPIRSFYESRMALPAGLRRLVLIDKENGGKADALNACINAARGVYVTSMDADSVLLPDALLRAVRPIVDDPTGVVAVGTQVGLTNGARIEDGRVVDVRTPSSWVARFQVVEYMRSFAQGRTALGALDSLLILSGVFALMRRDLLVSIGGFLTKEMKTRVGVEYCGDGAETVCEDMEVIVRLHRYLLDRELPGRVVFLPTPTAWTEAPENLHDLGKQRARWYRGLLEVLSFHRSMILRPRFGRIGMFALPYQVLFEALAPVLECLGYVLLVVTAVIGALDVRVAISFACLAAAINLCLSTLAVLLCAYSERGVEARTTGISLFPFTRLREVLLLMFVGLVSNFGYRQVLVAWQLRGLWDYLRGRKTWDKFARKGFQPRPA